MFKKKDYPLNDVVVFRDFRVLTEDAADNYGDRAALMYKEDPKSDKTMSISFIKARDDIRSLGTALIELGCREKHCAIIGPNSYNWIYSYFALMAIGAVTVPLDKDWPVADLKRTLERAECEYIFYAGDIADKIGEIRDENDSRTFVCMSGTPMEGDTALSMLIARGGGMYAAGDRSYHDYEIDPDRMATIVFTSGTTGQGKGVMLSQTNIVSDMTQAMYRFSVTEKTMNVLPLHHTFGSTVNIVGHYALGSTVYISSGLRYIAKELKEQQPGHLVLVPLFVESLYKKIWATAEKNGQAGTLRKMITVSKGLRKVGIDVRRKVFKSVLDSFGGKLELIICGGAPLNQDIIDTFEGIGITMLNGYGITECSPLISCNRNKLQRKGSVGLPIVGEEVKIGDPDETGCGEICVKGSNVMLGYYKDPETTAAAFDEEGFFRTGDYGRLDEDGWLYITGRIKNMIILSNGKNVYPEELETEISRIYGVSEVVVYAGESKTNKHKEVIVAEIFPDYDALKQRGIGDVEGYFKNAVAELNKTTAPYKSIGFVKIRQTEFAKNTSRKITRFSIDKSVD